MDYNTKDFQEKLEATHSFPSLYMFKFIVKEEKQQELKKLFPGNEIVVKPSSKGKYVSLTVKAMMGSSESIIDIYKKAHLIEGIIAL